MIPLNSHFYQITNLIQIAFLKKNMMSTSRNEVMVFRLNFPLKAIKYKCFLYFLFFVRHEQHFPLQYSCLENPMDGGAWQAAVHGVTKSRTQLSNFTFTHWRRKRQPTPVFLPGESQGRRSLVSCRLWGRTESDTTEVTQQQQQQHLLRLSRLSK